MGGGAVWWKGVQLDARTRDMMEEVVRLCPGLNISPSQGSWSGAAASAGTHSGCGAIDLMNLDAGQCDEAVAAMRRVGFAAWHRTPEQSDWPRHVHGIAVQPGGKHDNGCLSSAAHDQVVDFFNGLSGLASGSKDDGPREHVGTTWETYQQQQPDEDEGDIMLAIVAPSGAAYLIIGATRAHGIHDVSDLQQMETDGIPVVHLTELTFNSILAGRS